MDPTPHLTDLLRFARRQLRLRRARLWMMWATFGGSALTLAATLIGQPNAGLVLLPLVPLAGVAGYLRRSGSDGVIAQGLDEQLNTRELLASGVACRGKSDEGSAMILAQADARAEVADRSALSARSRLSRSEVAAGLVLAIAIAISVAREHSPELVTEIGSRANNLAAVPQRSSTGVNRNVDNTANGQVQPDKPEEGGPEGQANSAATSETVRRPAGDASGEGQAVTPSKSPPAIPSARGTRDNLSQGEHTGTGMARTEASIDDRPNVSSPVLARRSPRDADISSRPTENLRQRVQRSLDAEQLDVESRDLIRAYFHLDEKR